MKLQRLILILVNIALAFTACSEDEWESQKSVASLGKPKMMAEVAELKILAIDNSFTEDAVWHLPQLIYNAGENKIFFATLTASGVSLRDHWENSIFDRDAYRFRYSLAGKWEKIGVTIQRTR